MIDFMSVPITVFYVGIVVVLAFIALVLLWSGEDKGMQYIAPKLLALHGVHIDGGHKGGIFPLAFVPAFFGVWTDAASEAFEIAGRARSFNLTRSEVMLATVNALSFPLYLVPGGCLVAKLGEYLNQSPIRVQGRYTGNRVLCLTYLAEYLLVLFVAYETLMESTRGGGADLSEIAKGTEDEVRHWKALGILGSVFVLALVRVMAKGGFSGCCRCGRSIGAVAPRGQASSSDVEVGHSD